MAYGAPGKGNTLLNYCGVREDLIELRSIATLQTRALHPGTQIDLPPAALSQARPGCIFILPWNLEKGNPGAALLCSRMGREEVRDPDPDRPGPGLKP
ncbi:MAG: hypothetical protein R3E96_00035 [Planctomycetota bacterium]